MRLEDIQKVSVIGAGQMGAGIAQVFAAHGYDVQLADTSVELAQKAKVNIDRQLNRLVEKGKLSVEARTQTLGRITPMSQDASFEQADILIEAITENRDIKWDLFRRADGRLKKSAILASNTSSLSITSLAAQTARPSQVIGMHFMNPVPLMKLVEVVRGLQTSVEVLQTVRALAEKLEKTVIVSEDRPGFLVNRVLTPLLLEACFALSEGVGTAEDIDAGARLGLNHPMGPLELADLVGLDTVLAIAEVLHRELGEDKYRPPPLLRNLVAAGWLGRKTSRGFYVYDAQGQKAGPGLARA